jgi:hypothetical protein
MVGMCHVNGTRGVCHATCGMRPSHVVISAVLVADDPSTQAGGDKRGPPRL